MIDTDNAGTRIELSEADRQREAEWAEGKWQCLVNYVRSLSRNDQIKWAARQSEKTKEKMRKALSEGTNAKI